MTEPDTIPRRARYIIGGLAFALCVVTIAATGLWGDPGNAIHYFFATAGWGVVVLLLGGFGFGALASTVASIVRKS